MAGKLLPHPELSWSVPDDLSPAERVRLWLQLMDTCDQLLRAGLQRTVGERGDLRELYRDWYRRRMKEHDCVMDHMVREFRRRLGDAAKSGS